MIVSMGEIPLSVPVLRLNDEHSSLWRGFCAPLISLPPCQLLLTISLGLNEKKLWENNSVTWLWFFMSAGETCALQETTHRVTFSPETSMHSDPLILKTSGSEHPWVISGEFGDRWLDT
jgi:hypothetical protein